mmetsp:Transcript_18330/g.41729  ORF Transcript_18330/g.41729 Transcript_18330/m.41729 type:complete len:306 (-) Transcript_18330:52-969(-)
MKKLLSGGGKKDTKDKNKDKNFKEYIWPDGGKYEGEWKDGKMHGNGKFIEVNGTWYEGEWCEGKMQGNGTQVFEKGDRYKGMYYNGLRHGKGVQTFANGNKYEGDFWQGQIHGQGIYTCADGRRYAGEFKNNQKHGIGKYSGANGSYTGEYRNGKKHGKGSFTWTDGTSYEGDWEEDVMHGVGVRTERDGTRVHVAYTKGVLNNAIKALDDQSEIAPQQNFKRPQDRPPERITTKMPPKNVLNPSSSKRGKDNKTSNGEEDMFGGINSIQGIGNLLRCDGAGCYGSRDTRPLSKQGRTCDFLMWD